MKFTQQFLSTWKQVPVRKRLGIGFVVVVLVVGGSVAWSKASQPTWAVLYGNVDDAQASVVLAKLDAKGITRRMAGNGARIEVPDDQLVDARLALAADGVSDKAMPAGWSIMDNEGLATSDMKQRVDYQRALEGEIAKTLMGMDAVTTASVHLTLPEKPIYAGSSTDAAKPTAAVMLDLARPLTAEETETVANLVAGAVEGLTTTNVTVASSDGTTLHAAGEAGTSGGSLTTSKALKATQDFERGLESRLATVARQVTQRSDASVVVRAELDFDMTSVETETVDADKQVPSADHTLTEDWTGTGSAVGGTVGVDGGPLPTSAGSNGTYKKSDKTTTYTPASRSVTKTTQTPGAVKRMSVAVVVPFDSTESDTPEFDTEMVKRVVGAAAALDTTRGDTIEVATVAAGPAPTTTVAPEPVVAPVSGGISPAILGGVGGGIFLLALLFVTRRRKRRKRAAAPSLPAGDETSAIPAVYAVPLEPAVSAVEAEHARAEAASIRADLDRMANETPESLAALLSTWLTKG